MGELICSAPECNKPIVGCGVLVGSADDNAKLEWSEFGYLEYGGSIQNYIIVHPTCFVDLIQEWFKINGAEGMTALTVIIAPTGKLMADLEM